MGKRHREMGKAASTSQSVTSFFRPQVLQSVNEAEMRWSLFVAKHNLSFQTSDHATKLFKTGYFNRGSCTILAKVYNRAYVQ